MKRSTVQLKKNKKQKNKKKKKKKNTRNPEETDEEESAMELHEICIGSTTRLRVEEAV